MKVYKSFPYSITAFFFLFSPLLLTSSINAALVHKAQNWSENIITKCSTETTQKISELLHWSHKRSQGTLITQNASCTLLETTWSIHRACTETRLNPAQIHQHKDSSSQLITAHTNFLTAQQAYRTAQEKYLAILELLIEDTTQSYKSIEEDLKEMRDNARTVVAQALLKELPKLRQLIIRAQGLMTQGAQRFQNQPPLKSPDIMQDNQVKFLHHLWQFIPALMIKSFVTFNGEFHDISNACFSAFTESQRAGNAIWEVVEKSRSEYYATYHRIFDQVLVDHGLSPYVAY